MGMPTTDEGNQGLVHALARNLYLKLLHQSSQRTLRIHLKSWIIYTIQKCSLWKTSLPRSSLPVTIKFNIIHESWSLNGLPALSTLSISSFKREFSFLISVIDEPLPWFVSAISTSIAPLINDSSTSISNFFILAFCMACNSYLAKNFRRLTWYIYTLY